MGGAPRRILCVGASDPHGGGGLHMDVAVCRALAAEALPVTALDAERGAGGVERISLRDPEEFGDFLLRALEGGVDAVKTGALGDTPQVEILAEVLEPWHERVPVVVDPIVRSQHAARAGRGLLTEEGEQVVHRRLLPLARLATPVAGEYDEKAYRQPVAVLLQGAASEETGGGESGGGEIVDRFWSRVEDAEELRHPRAPGAGRLHGSRSALATAIACFLGRGVTPRHACERATHVVNHWLEDAVRRHDGRLVPATWDDRGAPEPRASD